MHFWRNALAHAGKSGRPVVPAFMAAAFAPDTPDAARAQWRGMADQLRPKLATLMDTSEHDVLACMGFAATHRAKRHSINPIKRLDGEIKRRAKGVGIFPNEQAITRHLGAILMAQSVEWAVQRAGSITHETIAPISDHPTMLSPVPGA